MNHRHDHGEPRPSRKLTEPDRLLCAHLARVRYLTKEQAWRLVYPGRWESKVSERLGALASLGLLRSVRPDGSPLEIRAPGGHRSEVIALTSAGYRLALNVLGDLPKVPALDVGAPYLEHATGVIELYLGMLGAGPERLGPKNRRGVKRPPLKSTKGAPAPLPTGWRWTPGESVRIPIGERRRGDEPGSKVLYPDALIEFEQDRRRVFVEWETGTNPIKSGKRAAIATKFDRYDELFRGLADFNAGTTWYASAFPDRWRPLVLFVLHSEQRKQNAAAALAEWAKQSAGIGGSVFALHTFEEARAMLGRHAGSSAPQAPNSVIANATSADDERLRPGRVSVRGEQLIAYEQLCGLLLRTVTEARRTGAPPPAPPPEAQRTYETLTVYAQRARKALAAHGLQKAV